MRRNNLSITALAFAVLLFSSCPASTRAQTKISPYPSMAPLKQYLIPNEKAEIALARSAAPSSVSDAAEVMVLGRNGYTTAVSGSNGFVCIVERSWGTATDDPQFWNPEMRAPHCLNQAAAKTFLPIYLRKTTLVLAGKSKPQIAAEIASELNKRELPSLAPGAMAYMMSKQQYLNDSARNWYPHVMFYVAGNVSKSWGANLPGSPVIAANDPQERVTVFMMVTGKWSDGTPAPPISY